MFISAHTMKVAIYAFALIGFALAEPPVSYLPPSNQYGAPVPSASYGTPSFGTHTAAIIKPNPQYGAPNQQYGAPDGGYQTGYINGGYHGAGGHHGYDDGPHEPANYNFEYHVYEPSYGNDFGHQESRQGDVAQGKYFVLLPDGRRQIVEYIADQNGYKPKISYEGTAIGDLGKGGYPGGPGGPGGYHHGGGGNGGYNY